MNDIYELETEKDHRHPPFWGWGEYIVKVTYKNGDIEILGSEVIEYRKKEMTVYWVMVSTDLKIKKNLFMYWRNIVIYATQ